MTDDHYTDVALHGIDPLQRVCDVIQESISQIAQTESHNEIMGGGDARLPTFIFRDDIWLWGVDGDADGDSFEFNNVLSFIIRFEHQR